MNLLMLAAIKKAVDSQKRGHRRKKEKGGKNNYTSNYSKTYTESEYLLKIINDDPALKDLFKIIESKGDEIDEKDAEVIIKKIDQKMKIQAERVEMLETIKKEVEDSGISLKEENKLYNSATVGIERSTTMYGKTLYKKDIKYLGLEYNGTILKKEWFEPENRNINPFETKYNNWIENNQDIDKKIENVEHRIKKLEKQLSQSIILKEQEKKIELGQLKHELYKLNDNKEEGENLKRDKENLDKFTPEQKEKIYKYYQIADECKETGKELAVDIAKFSMIKDLDLSLDALSYNERIDFTQKRKKWDRTIEELNKNGEVTEEMLDAVDSILSEEDLGYEKYDYGVKEFDISYEGISRNFERLVSWYLEQRTEKIYNKAFERKKAAYKVLEKHYTRQTENKSVEVSEDREHDFME